MPAYLLWMAREINDLTATAAAGHPRARLALSCAALTSLFWICTSDVQGRWTSQATTEYLEASDPRLAGWLPDDGGIFYNDSMTVFYRTFFKNPDARWRYALAYEPALMPPEDLKIYRKIQWNFHDIKTYEPWVEKMRPQDRLVLSRARSSRPSIGQLEWLYSASGVWIGRLPADRPDRAAGTPPDIRAQRVSPTAAIDPE